MFNIIIVDCFMIVAVGLLSKMFLSLEVQFQVHEIELVSAYWQSLKPSIFAVQSEDQANLSQTNHQPFLNSIL